MKRLTDPDFRYVSAAATDIRKTFERIRRERKEAEKAAQQHKVQSIFRSRANGSR